MTDDEYIVLGRIMRASGMKEIMVQATFGEEANRMMCRLYYDKKKCRPTGLSSEDAIWAAIAYGEVNRRD